MKRVRRSWSEAEAKTDWNLRRLFPRKGYAWRSHAAARADAALASNQNIENNPMQSSMVVAGIDALSDPRENILTRRANQRHYCIIAPFVKRRWPYPTTGASARLQAKNPYPQLKLHRLAEVASARHSEGSPLALPSRAHLPCKHPA